MGQNTPEYTFWNRSKNGIVHLSLLAADGQPAERRKVQFSDYLLVVSEKRVFDAMVAAGYSGPPADDTAPPTPEWVEAEEWSCDEHDKVYKTEKGYDDHMSSVSH